MLKTFLITLGIIVVLVIIIGIILSIAVGMNEKRFEESDEYE